MRLTRSRIVAAGVLVTLAAAALIALSARDEDGTSGPPALTQRARSAEALVDSIGVNVRMSYLDTAYARAGEVTRRLRALGVRHVRDAMPVPGEPLAAALRRMSSAGIRATLLTRDLEREPAPAVADALRAVPGGIEAFEGPNELDASDDVRWPATLTAHMPALEQAVRRRAPGVPVIGPSFVRPSESRAQLPDDLPGWLNEHPYAYGGPPEPALGAALRAIGDARRERPLVVTEAGYHDALRAEGGQPPTSPAAAAVYLPRLLVSAFGAGVRRTFVHELVDEKPDPGLGDPEQHFGLLHNDLSPKPAFAALRTLITALRESPGPRAGAGPAWRMRGGVDVQQLTLVRRDGSTVIAVWRPVSVWDQERRRPRDPGVVPVELTFDAPARDVAVWRPSASERPVVRRTQSSRLRLALSGDLVLVSLR